MISGRDAIEPMRTSSAVTNAFQAASALGNVSYTPHSARHYLAALGRQICRTPRSRKAWSLNLGHKNEEFTERYYGLMTDELRQHEIVDLQSDRVFSDEEKDLMLDYHQHRLHPGTTEFEMAKKLILKRESAPVDDVVVD